MSGLVRAASAALLALWLCVAATGQVVVLGGGASTVADAQGAGFTLYEADSTTQASFGYAEGLRVGASREIRSGPVSLTAGDSTISLALPTDLQGEYRFLQVRGALLQTRSPVTAEAGLLPQQGPTRPAITGRALIGWTGNGYQNAFFRSIEASKAVQLAEMHVALNRRFEISALAARGTQKSLLASAVWVLRPTVSAAVTTGWSGGQPVLRARLSGRGNTWAGSLNYTAGTLHLQPEPSLAFFTLERTGLNGSISKRVGNWLFLDASRNQYDTASAVDRVQRGVVADRSTFDEAGMTVRRGHAEAGVRLLQSTSGALTNNGTVAIAGWNLPRWSVHVTALRTVSPTYGADRSATVSSTQRLSQHLHITEGTTLGNGAPTADLGGEYENRLGSITVSHRETYVPFGLETGFHRLLAIGVHLHLGSTEVAVNQIAGRGLPTNYDVAVNGFYGSSLGEEGRQGAPARRLPGYAVQGRVTTGAGEPVRGAAVSAGKELVYTDSDGSFSAQFTRPVPVEVALQPRDFLSPTTYRAVSAALVVKPLPIGSGQPLLLQAEPCVHCAPPGNDPPALRPTDMAGNRPLHASLISLCDTLVQLGRRMLHVLPRRSNG